MKITKIAIILLLAILAYTKAGMNFPKGSDYVLHLLGGLIIAWILEKPYLYFVCAVLAEIAQPLLCANRGFELHDIVMNLAGCIIFNFYEKSTNRAIY